MFVVDDLAAWLVGLLADAGRKKLTNLLLGDAHERALHHAAVAAVQDTAEELSPSDSQRAGQIVMVINEVFGSPVPDAPLAGVSTLVEGLQAGIAGQLAVLDDADLTGTGRSSGEVLGVPGTVLADRLTGHLVREIMLRGSRSGPLTPLADQLNHDLTHQQVRRVEVQGQRVESMLARLADEVRDALAQPGSGAAAAAAGRPLDEVTDPFALEVHRPVQPEDAPPGLPALPTYVPRKHDTELNSVVRAAGKGSSGIAVLVGGSSTGKTRACWEALQLLRDQQSGWRLWHPIDPSRPDAALRELPAIEPRTVVWLNEAQFYLDPADGGLGERVVAGLRELLRDPARAPVLVLATLWPQFWERLTASPAGGVDPHAQARELLAGQDITVPTAFTVAQLHRLSQAGDARLAQAAAAAQDGQVIQFLAGAPELLARYRNAPPAAAALIHAAMDARRLGMGPALPQAFLEAAAPWYLTDAEWDALGEDWLEQALAYTAVPCKGVRGPLTRSRPHSARTRAPGSGSRAAGDQLAGRQGGTPGGPPYRLADYLDQHGRYHREGQFPPAGFWAAVADHAFPGDQARLGDAAHARGLYRDAAQIHKNAAARGNFDAVFYLSDPPHYLRADVGPLRWAAAHAPLDDPRAVARLLDRLRAAGVPEQVAALAERAAADVPLDDPFDLARLLDSLRAAGVPEQVAALAERAAAHATLNDPSAVADLLARLRAAGVPEQVAALAERAAADVPLDDPFDLARLLDSLRAAGVPEQAAVLLRRDPAAHVSLDDPSAVARLLDSLREAGSLFRLRAAGVQEQAAALAERAAAHVPLDDPRAVARLLDSLRAAGVPEQAAVLLRRDPAAHVTLDDPGAVARLREAGSLFGLRAAGVPEQAAALAERAAAHVSLDDPRAVARLLDRLRAAGVPEQAAVLAERAAAHVPLDDPRAVADLLDSLRAAGVPEQAAALAERAAAHVSLDDQRAVARLRVADAPEQAAVLHPDPAAHVSLDDPDAVARLLDRLRAAGALGQVAALAERAAAHVPLDDPRAVARLLDRLRAAGAPEQAAVLLRRDPAAHISLNDPRAVAGLLARLRAAGALGQVAALAERAAAHVPLDDPRAVARLLASLRAAGAEEQVTALADRLPGAGMFELFREHQERQDRFRFGREADGRPAESWGWKDLD